MNYYFGVRTTNKAIFLYYVGHNGGELSENLNVTTYIEKYDWDGRPLKRFQLNNFIWNFDLLPGTKPEEERFIGLDQSNEDPFIILAVDSI